jgi:hypothetical protein
MKKPAIPSIIGVTDTATIRILAALKENVELINGTREGAIQKIPVGASLYVCVEKINEIIGRLNATG